MYAVAVYVDCIRVCVGVYVSGVLYRDVSYYVLEHLTHHTRCRLQVPSFLQLYIQGANRFGMKETLTYNW